MHPTIDAHTEAMRFNLAIALGLPTDTPMIDMVDARYVPVFKDGVLYENLRHERLRLAVAHECLIHIVS